MAISLKHAFNSGKADGADATLVQPSNWNAEHTMTIDTDSVVGRNTAGTGAVEQLSMATLASMLEPSLVGPSQIWLPAPSWTPQATNGPEYAETEIDPSDVMIRTLNFDTTTAEYAQLDLFIPGGYDTTGNWRFRYAWSHPTTATNFGVSFDVHYRALGNNEVLSNTWSGGGGSTYQVDDTGGTADRIYWSDWSTGTALTEAAGDYMLWRIYRDVADAADNLAVDCRLHGVIMELPFSTLHD